MKINIPKLPIFFQFIIFLSIVEVLVMFILSKIGFGFFQIVPYLMIMSMSEFWQIRQQHQEKY